MHAETANIQTSKRRDEEFHHVIKIITESNTFNFAIIAVIFLNSIFLALETEREIAESWGPEVFDIMDYIFLTIYTLEFLMKIYAEPRRYWYSGYNLFDFIILILSFGEFLYSLISDNVQDDRISSLKVFRALRTLRTLRTISFIKGLQVLVTALVHTVRKWVINIVLLLLLIMFLFGIMGYYFFGYTDEGDQEHWGTLGDAMMTLFSLVTVDGWTDLQAELDDRDFEYSRVYTITFIVLGHFIFTNVFIGVIIMNISEATENYKHEREKEREVVLKHKKEFVMARQQQEIKKMMERQKRGKFTDFYEMVHDFEKSLSHQDSIMMPDLCTNIIWMETLMRTLDHMDSTMYIVQQLHFEMANHLATVLEFKLEKKFGRRKNIGMRKRSLLVFQHENYILQGFQG